MIRHKIIIESLFSALCLWTVWELSCVISFRILLLTFDSLIVILHLKGDLKQLFLWKKWQREQYTCNKSHTLSAPEIPWKGINKAKQIILRIRISNTDNQAGNFGTDWLESILYSWDFRYTGQRPCKKMVLVETDIILRKEERIQSSVP